MALPNDLTLMTASEARVALDNREISSVELTQAYLSYLASEEGQQAAADAAGSAPISDEMRADVQSVIDSIEIG